MRYTRTPLTLLLTLSLAGCFDSDEVLPDSDETGLRGLELSLEPGTLFGPCDPADVWGCDGAPGEWLACLRPVAGKPLSICALQTADPAVPNDCEHVTDPVHTDEYFGLGVELHASEAYCTIACETDEDCGHGKRCAPASHMCAWLD